MSNANSEYNVLAVLPWNAGVVSWFMFLLFLGVCFVWKSIQGPQFTHDKLTRVTYCASLAVFNWERSKPGTARSGSDLRVALSAIRSQNIQAKLCFIVARPAGFEKQEYNFHLFNPHKKKICRAYTLLASIKLTEK